jgi:hypothetical protein
MKKWLVAVGILLIISGLILFPSTSQDSKPTFRVESERVAIVKTSADEKHWEVSGYLNKGDRMVVGITQGLDWPFGRFEPAPENPEIALLYVFIDIIDPPPHNTKTRFVVEYALRNQQLQGGGPLLAVWRINVTESGGLNTTSLLDPDGTTYQGIGGVTLYEGVYTVKVKGTFPPREWPPTSIEIRKGILIEEKPNDSPLLLRALPTATLITVGATTSVFGLRTSKHRNSSLRRRRKS